MTPVSFHDFFGGCATVAGALIGLLFVAISVSPEKLTGRIAEADHQVKAGAAFSALVNTLVIALVALLPGASLGTTVLILSAAGLSSTAGLVIVLWREHKKRVNLGAIIMLAVLLGLYGVQLANGLATEQFPPQPRPDQQPGRPGHRIFRVRDRPGLGARRRPGLPPPVRRGRDGPPARHRHRHRTGPGTARRSSRKPE